MNLKKFQQAANISAELATRWFQAISGAMKEFEQRAHHLILQRTPVTGLGTACCIL
jgi:hypothetical protein